MLAQLTLWTDKECRKCGQVQPLYHFNLDSRRKDGRHPYCRTCRVKHYNTPEAKAKWTARNPDRTREAARRSYAKWRAATPYATKNPPDVRRDLKRASRKAWKLRHPERVRAQNRRARAVQRSAPLTSDALEYAAVLSQDPCAYCGGPAEHIDHIVAVARGGTGEWDNLTSACGTCNRSKNAYPLLFFMRRQKIFTP